MSKKLLFVALLALGACSAAKDESGSASRGNRGPVAHNAVVDCVLYDGMKKESNQLATVTSGTEVQVMDTVDAHFVKARVIDAKGTTQTGYMYRTCFSR